MAQISLLKKSELVLVPSTVLLDRTTQWLNPQWELPPSTVGVSLSTLSLEFLLRTLAVGIVLTEYFPAVDDGVVTVGEYEVPRRSLTGPSAFGESQAGSPKSTLERPPGSEIGGA